MPEIILKNLTKTFGSVNAVDKLDLTIEDRDFVTLLGPSGCGKTTTLRMISGLETPTIGEISIGGKVVFSGEKQINLSPDKRDVGLLFQNYALWPHMTVYQNIAFGLENMKWSKEEIRKRVREMGDLVKISDLLDRYPSELSGGQQQRVAIARTLAPNPKVLLMDEPLSNLDAKLRMEMRAELKRLHREIESTVVYVTHDQLEAMTLATKVCLLEEGVLQQYAPPLVIYDQPSNVFVGDFIGNPSMNFLDATVKGAEKDGVSLETAELTMEMIFKSKEAEVKNGDEVIIGLRPEDITLNPYSGANSCVIYSTLPSGMETVVRAKIKNTMFSIVVFGRVDFVVDSKMEISFPSVNYLLFDKATKNKIGAGSLKLTE
ncbi:MULTISPECIES: ABC transporter ATP-binding protein [unclassified Mesotoga]|jgi:multiple sugar transport system ATP-binding protein|nr:MULTISPECIES: ABC transporter ATP-binding protein [unclassified Mesotoga]PNS36550.1 ABC transporter [Mesotoga sp. B105.6.4]PVD15396.1 ABC transporter [Mesotoga sp. Brook.08.105.5.1]